MTRNDVSRILDSVVSLPLRFDQVTVNSGYAQKSTHENAVDQIETEQSCIMQSYSNSDSRS